MLELADSFLASAEELGEKKYQRKFHQLGRLRDDRPHSEPSARPAFHQAEARDIQEHEHHDRDGCGARLVAVAPAPKPVYGA